jgi:hypothetical protein
MGYGREMRLTAVTNSTSVSGARLARVVLRN